MQPFSQPRRCLDPFGNLILLGSIWLSSLNDKPPKKKPFTAQNPAGCTEQHRECIATRADNSIHGGIRPMSTTPPAFWGVKRVYNRWTLDGAPCKRVRACKFTSLGHVLLVFWSTVRGAKSRQASHVFSYYIVNHKSTMVRMGIGTGIGTAGTSNGRRLIKNASTIHHIKTVIHRLGTY